MNFFQSLNRAISLTLPGAVIDIKTSKSLVTEVGKDISLKLAAGGNCEYKSRKLMRYQGNYHSNVVMVDHDEVGWEVWVLD